MIDDSERMTHQQDARGLRGPLGEETKAMGSQFLCCTLHIIED